ncbi:MAG: hypothetical protein HYZ74_04370, partial [Elusimicrobia bacterium]|nr:hypothetical protein [Elusimicrobiota bacterium]
HGRFIIHSDLKLRFRHEGPQATAKFYEKYRFLANRWLDLCKTPGARILFVRTGYDGPIFEDCSPLWRCLKDTYPKLIFELLVLHGDSTLQPGPPVDGMPIRFLRQLDPYVWSGDNRAWGDIFRDVAGLA